MIPRGPSLSPLPLSPQRRRNRRRAAAPRCIMALKPRDAPAAVGPAHERPTSSERRSLLVKIPQVQPSSARTLQRPHTASATIMRRESHWQTSELPPGILQRTAEMSKSASSIFSPHRSQTQPGATAINMAQSTELCSCRPQRPSSVQGPPDALVADHATLSPGIRGSPLQTHKHRTRALGRPRVSSAPVVRASASTPVLIPAARGRDGLPAQREKPIFWRENQWDSIAKLPVSPDARRGRSDAAAPSFGHVHGQERPGSSSRSSEGWEPVVIADLDRRASDAIGAPLTDAARQWHGTAATPSDMVAGALHPSIPPEEARFFSSEMSSAELMGVDTEDNSAIATSRIPRRCSVRVFAAGEQADPPMGGRCESTPTPGGWTVTVLPMKAPKGALDLSLLLQWVDEMRKIVPRDFSRAVVADEIDDLLTGGAMSMAEMATALRHNSDCDEARHGTLCDDDDDYFCGEKGWGIDAMPPAGHMGWRIDAKPPAGHSDQLGGTHDDRTRSKADGADPRSEAVRLAHSIRIDSVALHEISRSVGAARGKVMASLTDRIVSCAAQISRLQAHSAAMERRRWLEEKQRVDQLLVRTYKAERESCAAATLSSGASECASDAVRRTKELRAKVEQATNSANASASEVATLRQIAATAAKLISRETAKVEAFATPMSGIRSEALPVVGALREVSRLLEQAALRRPVGTSSNDPYGSCLGRSTVLHGGKSFRSLNSHRSQSAAAVDEFLDHGVAQRGIPSALNLTANGAGANPLAEADRLANEFEQTAIETDEYLDDEDTTIESVRSDLVAAERLRAMMRYTQAKPRIGQPIFTG